MRRFSNYKTAEDYLIREVVLRPQYITQSTYELICTGFLLTEPLNNQNDRSNYEYAEEFFQWMLTGERDLSDKLLQINPWIKRFVDKTGLPENFSASYGWKIKQQLPVIIKELKAHRESRRAYINILLTGDQLILAAKTTHEYPCTVGLQLFIREDALHMIINMRSNNIYSVMPYDVYNMTRLQEHIAKELKLNIGHYHHQINNAHMYKGDIRRIKESLFFKP